MERLVPSQMELDRISTNCLLKTVRTVPRGDRKSFNCSNNIDSDDFLIGGFDFIELARPDGALAAGRLCRR